MPSARRAKSSSNSTDRSEKKRDQPQFTSGALFAGIGGFVLGLKRAGIRTIWANDSDPKASETFRLNHADCRLIEKDVRSLRVALDGLKPVHILTAGFPCQAFSAAGDRKGFGDFRGELFFEIIRIVKEFGDQRPPILFLENVPFLQHGNGGRWFEIIRDEIQLAGYWFGDENSCVVNTVEATGIPQERNRLFMVALSTAHFRSNRFCFPTTTSERKALWSLLDIGDVDDDSYYLPETNKYYAQIMRSVANGSKRQLYQYRKYFVRPIPEGLCPTLTANMGIGGHNVPFVLDGGRLRKLTEFECARLQGFNDGEFRFPESLARRHRYTQLGNTVTVPVVESIARGLVRQLETLRR
jgi:DNA (cytosine-5)-methyltransferase 1